MKTTNNIKIAKLAEELSYEFNKNIPITILPSGDIVFKNYIIHPFKEKWVLYNINDINPLADFNLKSCALMAAKEHDRSGFNSYRRIKFLDGRYWANHCDELVYKYYIKNNKDIDKQDVYKTKLDISKAKAKQYKQEISTMFKMAFA